MLEKQRQDFERYLGCVAVIEDLEEKELECEKDRCEEVKLQIAGNQSSKKVFTSTSFLRAEGLQVMWLHDRMPSPFQ